MKLTANYFFLFVLVFIDAFYKSVVFEPSKSISPRKYIDSILPIIVNRMNEMHKICQDKKTYLHKWHCILDSKKEKGKSVSQIIQNAYLYYGSNDTYNYLLNDFSFENMRQKNLPKY